MRLAAIALVASLFCSGADLNNLKQTCIGRANLGPGQHWLEDCIIDFFTLQPLHPALNSIAPTTGIGVGLGIDQIRRRGRFEYIPSARALVSKDGSTLFKGSLTVGFPGFALSKANPNGVTEPYLRGMAANGGHPEIDAKASFMLHAERFDLHHQNFYGEGNSTTQSNLAVYRLQQTSGGVTATDPVTSWAAVSLSGDYLQPNILGATSDGRPSIVNTDRESSAPGLRHQPGFARFQPAIRLLFKPVFAEFIEVKASYAFYHSTDGALYSFRQFDGSAAAQRVIRIQTKHTASNHSAFFNAVCVPLPAKECSPGNVTVKAFATTSQTAAGSVVPFYLQPALGGSNPDGTDTLRGYRDYRFRAPNILGFQAEMRHQIWGPVGVLGFYDVGQVALKTSDLGSQNFHHAIGVGMYVSAANVVVLRISVGWGTHEGVLGNVKAASGLF